MDFISEHSENMPALLLIVGKTLGRAMGSPTAAMLWAVTMTSPDVPEWAMTAGFKPTPTISDDVFQAVRDHLEGILLGPADLSKTFEKIKYDDKLLHIYC